MIQWHDLEPDFVVDVSDFIEHKFNAIKAYATQFLTQAAKSLAHLLVARIFSNLCVIEPKIWVA